jgi:hypothetical protein
MESGENLDKEGSTSITKRSLMAIRQMGRNTAMILRKEDPPITGEVSLREVTRENFWAICNLKVHTSQEEYVATNVVSIAEAYFSKTASPNGSEHKKKQDKIVAEKALPLVATQRVLRVYLHTEFLRV